MAYKAMVILLLSFLLTAASADPDTDYQAANKAAEAKDYEKALTLYRKVLEEAPSNAVLWNAGLCAYLAGDGKTAVEFWKALKASAPLDWQARSKLVQAYQLLNDLEAVDREREELLALQKAQPELFERPSFCREQFKVGDINVMAFESFEMIGPRGVKYTFYILDSSGNEDYRVSLGSYDQTNAISHELGETPEGVRLYHLDGYYEGGRRHRTFAFYQGEPSYSSVREQVVGIISGKTRAISESGPGPER